MFRRPTIRYGQTPEPTTPYQRAAQVWDDRIGSARVQAKNWRLAFFGALALSGGLTAGIVWQSARAVLTRSLDGVEPGITEEIRHAAGHVPGVAGVADVRARWMGHKLHADLAVTVDPALSVAEAARITASLEGELKEHLPMLADASIRFTSPSGAPALMPAHDHRA